MNETEQILVAVTEAHSASDTALEIGGGAGHIEGDHALILVPDVDHAVDLLVRGVYAVLGEQPAPVLLKLVEQLVRLFGGIAQRHHFLRLFLVDNVFEGLFIAVAVGGVACDKSVVVSALVKLLIDGHFHIAQAEYQIPALVGSKLHLNIVGRHRRPALRHGHIGLAREYRIGALKAVVQPEEALPVGVVAVDGAVYGVEREVIAALLVFGLVVDSRAEYLNLAGVEVPLEVGGVVVCVPQAPLQKTGELERFLFAAFVGYCDFLNFTVEVLGNKEFHLSLYAVLFAGDYGVAHTVAALVAVKLRLDGRPAGVPHRIAVLYIEISSPHINGDVVVTIACDTAQASVLVKAVSSRGVGYKREKSLRSQVIYPGIGGAGRGDDVLSCAVVKVAEFHKDRPSLYSLRRTTLILTCIGERSRRQPHTRLPFG